MAHNYYNNGEERWGQQNFHQPMYNAAENRQFPVDEKTTQFADGQLNFQPVEPSVSCGAEDPNYTSNPYLQPNMNYTGSIYTPTVPVAQLDNQFNDYENEPPLLEELGINPDHILQKTLLVLNPFRATNIEVLQDNDLAGPLVFCLAFGGFLLLSGKIHFNYIYGIGVIGSLAMYCLLYEMAVSGVTLPFIVSVIGYCLLPMVILSGVNIVFSLQGIVGTLLTILAVAWCSISSSKLFVTALSMTNQLLLVAYPCALLYSVFALIIIF